MMNYYGYGGWGMMGRDGAGVTGLIGLLTWIALFLDLVLLGIWLWKHINHK